MALSQLLQMLGQVGTQPTIGDRFMQGQQQARELEDRDLTRRRLEQQLTLAEQLAPYELLKAQREATVAGQPKMTEKAKQVQDLVNEGVPRSVAVNQVYGTERTYTDPTTGNIVSYNTLEQYLSDLGATTPKQKTQAAGIMEAEERGEIPTVDTMAGQPASVPPGGRVLARGTKEEERRAAQIEKEYTRTREFKQDVNKFGESYANANIGVMEGELSNAEKLLQENATTVEVPGRGPVERFLPSFMKSDEGREFTQTMQSNFNRMLKERSGAAVTEQEFQRLSKEAGVDTFDTQDQVILGVKLWRQALENTRAQLYGTTDPEVASEYENRSDLRARPFSPEVANDNAFDSDGRKYKYAPAAELPDGTRIYRLGEDQPWRYADGTIYVRPPAGKQDASPSQTEESPTGQSASGDPTQQAIGILRNELDKGTSKDAVLNTLNAMRAEGNIDMKQYRNIVRELQLGTFNIGGGR